MNIDFAFPIIGFTETKLTYDNKFLFDIADYTSYHLTVNKNPTETNPVKGHGVSIYIQNTYDSRLLTKYTSIKGYLECIFTEVSYSNKSVIIGTIYRPPNSNVNSFIKEYFEMITCIKSEFKKPIYMMGDYNLDLLKYDESKYVCEFLDMFF